VNASGAGEGILFDRFDIATVYDFRNPVERSKPPGGE
jgi:hypothetical protein